MHRPIAQRLHTSPFNSVQFNSLDRKKSPAEDVAKSNPFAIAIDLDRTFGRDPVVMGQLVNIFKKAGHKVYLVSMERQQGYVPSSVLNKIDGVYLTGGQPKREYMAKLGIAVDTWMDDRPETMVMTKSQAKQAYVPLERKSVIVRWCCLECGMRLQPDKELPGLSQAEIDKMKVDDAPSVTMEYFNSKEDGRDVVVKCYTEDRCRTC